MNSPTAACPICKGHSTAEMTAERGSESGSRCQMWCKTTQRAAQARMPSTKAVSMRDLGCPWLLSALWSAGATVIITYTLDHVQVATEFLPLPGHSASRKPFHVII